MTMHTIMTCNIDSSIDLYDAKTYDELYAFIVELVHRGYVLCGVDEVKGKHLWVMYEKVTQ